MNKFFLFAVLMSFAVPALASDPIRPDPTLTPGAVNDPPTPLAVLCQSGHTKQTRHVSAGTKKAVLRAYGFDPKSMNRGNYEIDHLISLEIDGSNDLKNLWPQSYITQPFNAHRKDVLENALHRLVCDQKLDLATAQHEIATDWVAAYTKYVLGGMTQ